MTPFADLVNSNHVKAIPVLCNFLNSGYWNT